VEPNAILDKLKREKKNLLFFSRITPLFCGCPYYSVIIALSELSWLPEKKAKCEDNSTAVISALYSTCLLNSWALFIPKWSVILTATAILRQTADASHRENQKLCH
jgi:hypothetical protein